MNQYIAHLIEDLKALHREPLAPWYNPEENIELEYEDVERYLCSGQEQKIGTMLDLQPEQFPPVHQLTPTQMQTVVTAYTELLLSWGICLVLPEGIPADMAYKTVTSTLTMKAFVSQYGMVTLEFCSHAPEACPFGQWCHCE